MSVPSTRDQLKAYCLRELGAPQIKINIDDEQLDDRLDEALSLYQLFHFDGIEKVYLKHQITADDIANTYIQMPDSVVSVERVLPITSGTTRITMFDLMYQLRLNDIQTFTSTSMIDFYLIQRHMRLIDMMFNGDPGSRFNVKSGKLYIEWNWGVTLKEGEFTVIECNRILDPNDFPKIYNDWWLRRYLTQLIKRQWGQQLKKFTVTLPGNVTYNGQQIYDEADAEIKRLEIELRETYEEPPRMMVG